MDGQEYHLYVLDLGERKEKHFNMKDAETFYWFGYFSGAICGVLCWEGFKWMVSLQ